MIYRRGDKGQVFFLLSLLLIAVVRLALSISESITIDFSPFDSSWYVRAANNFLSSGNFGEYTDLPLLKAPGFPILIAILKIFQISYWGFLNFFVFGASLFLAIAINKVIQNKLVAAICFFILLFNPITFSVEWHQVMREPLASYTLVAVLSCICILLLKPPRKFFGFTFFVLVLLHTFFIFLREEGVLIFILSGSFVLAYATWWRHERLSIIVPVCALFALLLVAVISKQFMSFYLAQSQTAPVIHDFSEGEYPKLLSQIRAVEDGEPNRLAQIRWATLQKIADEIPQFADAFYSMPRPSFNSNSCLRDKVCSEWTYPHLSFWLLNSIAQTKRFQSVNEAQHYYKTIRLEILHRCQKKLWDCHPENGKFLRGFELKWLGAQLFETADMLVATVNPSFDIYRRGADQIIVPEKISNDHRGIIKHTEEFESSHIVSDLYPSQAAIFLAVHLAKWVSSIVIIFGLLAFFVMASRFNLQSFGPWVPIMFAVVCYAGLRALALGFLGVQMGAFDGRLVFDSFSILLVSSLVTIHVIRANNVAKVAS